VIALAHPKTLGLNGYSELESLLLQLVKDGLRGLEVYYPEHSAVEVTRYKTLAERCGLVTTGGTDYHGLGGNGLDIGVGRGEMRLPYSMVVELKSARNRSLTSGK
jgi:predicted metal-dependent phosphoesterase TrpH